MGLPLRLSGKESACNTGDSAGALGLTPESEDPPEKEMATCLENPMDRGAWRATVHGVAESWTQLETKQQQ